MDINSISLLTIGIILFVGYFAEFIFRRFQIPDTLFLIALGVILGPYALSVVTPATFVSIAPVFTTFTLIFLLFEGSFSINLRGLIMGANEGIKLTLFNFVLSSSIITFILWLFGVEIVTSLFTGFALGGVSSAFVIPMLQGLNIKSNLYSVLTLESALTDVFCIVFALTMVEIHRFGGLALQSLISQIFALFAVAAALGVIAAYIWINLQKYVFKEQNYMVTIAYICILFVVTEFVQGSGAISALFFGLTLNNNKRLQNIVNNITNRRKKLKNVVSRNEEFFYKQVSFLLKTLFFVYIGILINFGNTKALIIGCLISIILLGVRRFSHYVTKKNTELVNNIFARGLAAAAVGQVAVTNALPSAMFVLEVIYVVITGTIILSSIMIYVGRKAYVK